MLRWLYNTGKFMDLMKSEEYEWSQLHVVALQGNDSRPRLFNFNDLIESNRQLREMGVVELKSYPGLKIPHTDDPLRDLRELVVEITRVG